MKATYKFSDKLNDELKVNDNSVEIALNAKEPSVIMPANDNLWDILSIDADEWDAASKNGFLIF